MPDNLDVLDNLEKAVVKDSSNSSSSKSDPLEPNASKPNFSRPSFSRPNLSTKTGDQGQTSLADGSRLSKADLKLEVVGSLDELNSWLGLVVVELGQVKDSTSEADLSEDGLAKDDLLAQNLDFLLRLQNDLFKIGAEIAGAKPAQESAQANQETLQKIEQHSNQLQQALADDWHSKFVFPGGSELAARLDLARSVCRRLERRLVELSQQQEVGAVLLKVINRMSDYLYALRLYVNAALNHQETEFNPD